MEDTLNQRKEKLKKEIEIALKLLEENINNASIKDYISMDSADLPGALDGIVNDPSQTISTADMISRTILPEHNLIRQLFKYLSLINRGYKIISSK